MGTFKAFRRLENCPTEIRDIDAIATCCRLELSPSRDAGASRPSGTRELTNRDTGAIETFHRLRSCPTEIQVQSRPSID
jgi:hypothetical protein